MKKLFAIILAALMIASVMVFTANAADNEWEVYASVGTYKDESEYEDEDDRPHEPGLRYTEAGVQMYSATTEQLDAMNKNAWGGLQLKEKVKLTDGFTMTAVIDKYTDKQADKWIAFCLWTDPKATPADTDHGKGWFVLCRPSGANMTLLSFIDEPTNIQTQMNIQTDIYSGEALVLDVKKGEDGKMKVFVNDQDMKCDKVFDYFENGEAYVSIVLHQGNRDEIAVTITDVNGVKPTGTDAKEPFVSSDAKPREPGPEVPANEPCYLWNADRVKKGKPGAGLTSIVNDDGSLHISFTNDNASQINPSVKDMYDAEQFPVWAVKFKNLDELVDGNSSLWYCAGEVLAAQEGSNIGFSWSDCDYEEEDGWKILAIDLTGENYWEGTINSFRLDITSSKEFTEEDTFDIDWIGFFRSEKEAYTYAGFGDLYSRIYEKGADTEEVTTEAVNDDTTAAEGEATTAAEGETGADTQPADTTKTDDGKTTDDSKGLPVPAIIGIIAGVAVIIAVVVIVIVTNKKKKA
jgi:hypothetical protein